MNHTEFFSLRRNILSKDIGLLEDNKPVLVPLPVSSCGVPVINATWNNDIYSTNLESNLDGEEEEQEIKLYTDIFLPFYQSVKASVVQATNWVVCNVMQLKTTVTRVAKKIYSKVGHIHNAIQKRKIIHQWACFVFVPYVPQLLDTFSNVHFDKVDKYNNNMIEKAKAQEKVNTILTPQNQKRILWVYSLFKKRIVISSTKHPLSAKVEEYKDYPLHPLHNIRSVEKFDKMKATFEEKTKTPLSMDAIVAKRVFEEQSFRGIACN